MGTPKALLTLHGETFLDRLIGLFQPVCGQVVVVLGYQAETITQGLAREADFVTNPDPSRGQFSSLQCGFRALRPGARAVFFTPVDYAGVDGETIEQLAAARGEQLLTVPQFGGKHGHPVLAEAPLIPFFTEDAPERTAREIIHSHVDRTRYVNVEDPGVTMDVDTPEAYEQLKQAVMKQVGR